MQADEPPFSRIFVTCPTNVTKEVLQQVFAAYGMVQYVQMVSKPPLGFTGRCFVKYDRASSAALAIENLNGVAVEGGHPLSVELAVPKGQTKDVLLDNEVPPRSRLFVTYLKSIPDEEFKAKF
eukprot:EG_transcript_50381